MLAMLTAADIAAWVGIQDGLARASEREFEARVQWAWYERRRAEIAEQIGGRHEGR